MPKATLTTGIRIVLGPVALRKPLTPPPPPPSRVPPLVCLFLGCGLLMLGVVVAWAGGLL